MGLSVAGIGTFIMNMKENYFRVYKTEIPFCHKSLDGIGQSLHWTQQADDIVPDPMVTCMTNGNLLLIKRN